MTKGSNVPSTGFARNAPNVQGVQPVQPSGYGFPRLTGKCMEGGWNLGFLGHLGRNPRVAASAAPAVKAAFLAVGRRAPNRESGILRSKPQRLKHLAQRPDTSRGFRGLSPLLRGPHAAIAAAAAPHAGPFGGAL